MSFHHFTFGRGAGLGVLTLATVLFAAFVGCSVDEENVAENASMQRSENPWADGEDCRPWGCAEKRTSGQSIVAPPSNAQSCATDPECASGFCVDGVCCDSACAGTCQACTAAKKGQGADGICGDIALYGDPDNECLDGTCDGSGICKNYNGVTCTDPGDCLSGNCVDGVCCGNACDDTCRACSAAKKGGGFDGVCGPIPSGVDPDGECNTHACDGAGKCALPMNLLNGIPCAQASQCISGFCVDGVCCGNACTETCKACSNRKKGYGFEGACENIAVNLDPDEECINGVCNGAGACTLPLNLLNGYPCSLAVQCISGYCADGVCCGQACTESCRACSAAKKGYGIDGYCDFLPANTDPDDECLGGVCDGTGVCTTPANLFNGQPCKDASECASGSCADGVCCGQSCMEPCLACSAAKKGGGQDGVCGPVAANTDPDDECFANTCNGTGACSPPVNVSNGQPCNNASECSSGYCTEGVCCGQGCTETCVSCLAAKKGSGADGTCGSIPANTDPDDECYGGTCDGAGACTPTMNLFNGQSCTNASQCASGYCADGVCCGQGCTEPCLACSAAAKGGGVDGVCGPIPANTDPKDACPGGTCDGAGACTPPVNLFNGQPCNNASECASGYCADGVCCGQGCTETCLACSAAKKGGGVDGICGPVAANTDPDNECLNGNCNGAGVCTP